MNAGATTATQTESQRRDPWAPAQPALQTILGRGLNLYNNPVGPQVYQGDRVAGFSPDMLAGMDYMRNNATAGQGAVQAGTGYIQGLLDQGGSTADTRAATRGLLGVDGVDVGGIRRVANQMGAPNSAANRASNALMGDRFQQDASGFRQLNRGLEGPTQVQQSLQDAADGRFLGEANPYTSQMIANGQADAISAAKGAFAASGRYGSGMFSGAVGDAASRVATDLRYKDYEAERARQAQAAQAIDQGLLARTGARQSLYNDINDTRTANAGLMAQGAQLDMAGNAQALQGQQALANQQQANNQQRIGQYGAALGSAQSDRAASMAGIAALPGLQQAAMAPGQTLMNLGNLQQQQQQRELAAQQDKFNEIQNAPWKRLGLLSQTTMPIASLGGTQSGTTTTTPAQPGILQQILGGAAAGVGLLGGTGAFGPIGGAAAGLGGGSGGGWLSSMFSSPPAALPAAPVPQSGYTSAPVAGGWGGYNPYYGSPQGWV